MPPQEAPDLEGLGPEKFQESFRNRHQKESDRLRIEIEGLVRQANILLHGNVRLPPRPNPGKRNDREGLLEATLEKSAWYRHEIKRLRKDLESWDRLCSGPNCVGAQERDPMETYNLLVEKRKELQRLQRNGTGLDRVAAAQRKAEAEQNALTPENETRLRNAKDDVEQQKRLHIRMQAERQKVVAAKKKAEQEVRAANTELRSKAAQLQRPPRPTKTDPQGGEPQQLRQLRRDVDILSEAVWQDERKHKAGQRDDEQQLDYQRRAIAKLRTDCAGHDVEIAKLRAVLTVEEGAEILPPVLASPRGGGISEGSPHEVFSPSAEKPSAPSPPSARKPAVSSLPSPTTSASARSPGNAPAVTETEVDAEESDDMAALVAPMQHVTSSGAASVPQVPSVANPLPHVGGGLAKADIFARLAEASISGLLPQKLQEGSPRIGK